jgi:hypothetical protein
MENTSDNKDFSKEEMTKLIIDLPNIIRELEKENSKDSSDRDNSKERIN